MASFSYLVTMKWTKFYFTVLHNVDIDECASGDHKCLGSTATCTNTVGSYSCSCKTGYVGDGKTSCTPTGEWYFAKIVMLWKIKKKSLSRQLTTQTSFSLVMQSWKSAWWLIRVSGKKGRSNGPSTLVTKFYRHFFADNREINWIICIYAQSWVSTKSSDSFFLGQRPRGKISYYGLQALALAKILKKYPAISIDAPKLISSCDFSYTSIFFIS